MELDLGLGESFHLRTQYQGTGHHNLLITQPRDKAQFLSYDLCPQFAGNSLAQLIAQGNAVGKVASQSRPPSATVLSLL